MWWLTASAAELKQASTCRQCGCPDADIDLGLCFVCFSQQQDQQHRKTDQERDHELHLLNARVKELEEALRPFADQAEQIRDDCAPDRPRYNLRTFVEYEDLEHAETVLNGIDWVSKAQNR
jgi:hypothetical protein